MLWSETCSCKPVSKGGPHLLQSTSLLLFMQQKIHWYSTTTPQLFVLTTRANQLVKEIETEAGEIRLNLYDNGWDRWWYVNIYHDKSLLMAHTRLSYKSISFRIPIDLDHPHHKLIMVADNLGSFPPNTLMMIVASCTKRYQVFISSQWKEKRKVVLNLKE